MTDHTSLIERYIASWNETDAAARRRLIAETFTADASYVDPLMQESGHDGIGRLIDGVQAQFPGFRFALTRPVDSVADHVRFSWQLGPSGGEGLIEGTDFARVTDDRLALVRGFLDRVPETAA